MSMTVGVTGGAGFIGCKLVRRLLDRGYSVRVLDDFRASAEGNLSGLEVDLIEGDIRREESVAPFVEGLDFLYDLAAIAHIGECERKPEESFLINAYGRHVVLRELERRPIRGYLFPSSVFGIYGTPEYSPVDEQHPVSPRNLYGVAKRASELMIMSHHRKVGTPVVVVRQSNVYGPSPGIKYDSVTHIFIEQCLQGRPLTIHGGDEVRNFIYIDDLLDAYLAVLDRGVGGGEIINLAGFETSIRGLADLVESEVRRYQTGGSHDETASAAREPVGARLVSTEKARETLGFEPQVDLQEGVRRTVQYIAASAPDSAITSRGAE